MPCSHLVRRVWFDLEGIIHLVNEFLLLLLIVAPENDTSVVEEEAVGIACRRHVHPQVDGIDVCMN